ncbi:MAG: hypothetical protein ABSB58_01575 [Gemmatimonadales bacterium]
MEHPTWLDRPALGRLAASTPLLWKPLAKEGLSYADGIKPMNFLLSAQVAPLGHPAGADPKHFHLIASYTSDPRQWPRLQWTDVHSARRFRATTKGLGSVGLVRVVSYRDVLEAYELHPEPKSAAADGSPCSPATLGLLARLSMVAVQITHIGKESNLIEDVEAGWIHDVVAVVSVFGRLALAPSPGTLHT